MSRQRIPNTTQLYSTFRFMVFDFYYLPVHPSFQSAPYKKMPLL